MHKLTVGLVYGPLLDVGGVETHLLQILQNIDQTRISFVIFSSATAHFSHQVEGSGATVLHWSPQHAFDWKAAHELEILLRTHPVDLLHIHHPRALWPASQAAKKMKLLSIATVHVPAREMVPGYQFLHGAKSRLYYLVERWLLMKRMKKVIFVSGRTRSKMKPIPHAITIPNGIEINPHPTDRLKPAMRSSLNTGQEQLVLIAVGRMHYQKGFDLLLKAFSSVVNNQQKLVLWIVGEGPERAALEALAAKLKLEHHVQFLGAREDISSLLKAADIFVMSSRYEGMPQTLLEAMAAGLPVISTDVGESGDVLLNGKVGMLVPQENIPALSEGITKLCQDTALRTAYRAAALDRVKAYNIQPLVHQLSVVYTEVIPFVNRNNEG